MAKASKTMIENKEDEKLYSLFYLTFFAGFMLASLIWGVIWYFYTH